MLETRGEADEVSIARMPLFAGLDREAFGRLFASLRRVHVRPGATIVEEGAPGASMFVVVRGTVRVVRREESGEDRVIDDMGAGEIFGEMALVSGGPRLATVIAVTDVDLLEIAREQLDAASAVHPEIGETVTRFYKERLLANVLRASPLFGLLPEAARRALVDVVQIRSYPPRTMLIEERKPGRGFFVLLRGRCEVFHRFEGGREASYPTMHEGDVFGELSLLHGGDATANVRTQTACVVLELRREWFDALLLANPDVRSRIYAIAGERVQRTREILARESIEKRLV